VRTLQTDRCIGEHCHAAFAGHDNQL